MTSPLRFDTDFDATPGIPVPIDNGIIRLTAPNSGPYTFTGTNSFIIGTDNVAIVDPGPDNMAHFSALQKAVSGRQVVAIILTHTHKDHSALAPKLAQATGAPIWFEGPHRLSRSRKLFEINPLSNACDWALMPDRRLADGEAIQISETALNVVATPGHCANHLAFGIGDTPYLLTGDHVMGWNSTLVATPDGSMAAYISSLDALAETRWTHYLPAHGGPIADGPTHTMRLKDHRLHRNAQIKGLLVQQKMTVSQLREAVYPDLPVTNQRAAMMTLQAHLEYLNDLNEIKTHISLTGRQYSLQS